jgi:hypothetical protein
MKLKLVPKLILGTALILLARTLTAQTADTLKTAFTTADSLKAVAKADSIKAATKPNSLTISVDMRTRTEIRHGYSLLPTQDTSAAFFTNQRTRLNFDFKTKKFDFYASLQDTRVWGQQDPREGQGTATPTEATTYPLYLFEIYAEPHFGDKFSVRIGRQRIMYDNQRLFAENDWRLPGNSHDAIRFIYNNKINFTNELAVAYNQYGENTFTANYKPVGFVNYKALVVDYLSWKISKSLNFITINTADGYQSSVPADYKTTYMRFTTGGRLEYSSYKWYFTMSGYYQFGKDSAGKKLSAYYLQPEIKYSGIKNLTIRLGMEYLSGQDTLSSKDNNFVPLYGVAHRFMGNMDFFARFPADVNSGGLINPYLFFMYQNKKLTLRLENHLFYSQSNAAFKGKGEMDNYLGFENDWRINYKLMPFFEIESGFCWAAVTKSMTVVKKSGDTKAFPYWYYLSLKFTPTIGKFTF